MTLSIADGEIANQGRAVLTAMLQGSISPHEARDVFDVLEAQVRLVAASELDRRLSALEQRNDSAPAD